MNNKISRFDLIKINRDSKKICNCKRPHYHINLKNRMIQCKDCDAYIDPFEALETICDEMDRYFEYEKRALEICRDIETEIKSLKRKKLKLKLFKDLEKSYIEENLFPRCPNCHEAIDPAEITNFVNYKHLKHLENKSKETILKQ